MKTLAKFKVQQAREELKMLRAALIAEDWRLARAAARLGCPPTTLRRLLDRHGKLSTEYAKRSPGRGRPPIAG